MAPRRHQAVLLRALLALGALCAVPEALACSSVSYSSPNGAFVASARHMDFAALPPMSISYVPSGLNDTLIPVYGQSYSTLGRTYTRKFNYACVSFSRKIFYDAAAKVFPAIKQWPITNWPGICNDGLNSAGLGVALQWQLDTRDVPAYNPAKPGPAVDQIDFANYVLANFDSVDALKKAFADGFSVTFNPLFMPATLLAIKKPYIPCHWGVWDRFNKSLVVEFSDRLTVYDNPTGVLTNNPLFPQQLQYLEKVATIARSPPNNQPPLTPSLHGTNFLALPGSYNSSDRFSRLAMLKSAANLAPWADRTNPTSPAFALKDSSNPALISVMSIIDSVYLPKGVDDSGGVGPKEDDWTIFSTLRDHTKQRYFWRVANTPQWSVVDLNKVKWGQLRAKYAVGSFMMLANPWWAADRSNAWQLGNILDTATASKEKIVACMSGCLADPTIANPDAFALCVHACL